MHLIDRLEELVGEARRLPIGSGVVMDRRRLLDLVDQMRTAVPSEITEAREILSEREEVLRQAHEDAAIVRAKADEEVEQRLAESDLVKTAQARAEMLIQEAQARIERLEQEAQERARSHMSDAENVAARQMDEADRYALEILRKLQQQLGAFISNVQAGIETLEAAPSVESSRQEPPQEETPPADTAPAETPSTETPQEEQEP
ncbi:MAG: hypothetical protein WBF66_05205 [Dehalococcoidia bacterium]